MSPTSIEMPAVLRARLTFVDPVDDQVDVLATGTRDECGAVPEDRVSHHCSDPTGLWCSRLVENTASSVNGRFHVIRSWQTFRGLTS